MRTVKDIKEKAIFLFEEKRIRESLIYFEELEKMDEADADVFFYIGSIHHLQGKLGKAIKYLYRTLEIYPEHTQAAVNLSVLLNDIGRYEEAQSIFAKIESKNKVSLGEEQNADQHLNKKFANKHYEIAELYFSYQRYEEAIAEYQKSIRLNPEDLKVQLRLAKVLSKKGYITKAIEELKRLKYEHPEYLDGRVALGLLYYSSNDIIQAEDEWEYVLKKDPLHQEAMMYLNLAKNASEATL